MEVWEVAWEENSEFLEVGRMSTDVGMAGVPIGVSVSVFTVLTRGCRHGGIAEQGTHGSTPAWRSFGKQGGWTPLLPSSLACVGAPPDCECMYDECGYPCYFKVDPSSSAARRGVLSHKRGSLDQASSPHPTQQSIERERLHRLSAPCTWCGLIRRCYQLGEGRCRV